MNENPSVTSHLSPLRYISWLTIILAFFAVGTFLAVVNTNTTDQNMPVAMGGFAQSSFGYDDIMPSFAPQIEDSISAYQQLSMKGTMPPPPPLPYNDSFGGGIQKQSSYPYRASEVPVVDKREFLKVRYDAQMRTRDVSGLTHRVETTVRENSGRIDHSQSSSKYGYVNFVVPMKKYDAFHVQIEKMVGSRFILVNTQSENLLPHKQSIEEQQKQTDDSLIVAKSARQTTVDNHLNAIKSLKTQIEREAEKLISLRAQTQTPQLQAQIEGVLDDVAALRDAIASENNTYKVYIGYAEENVKIAQEWQSSVKKQDNTLMDDVATVSGSVSIRWISMWQIALLYLPGYWIPTIFAILAFLSYLWDRRRFGIV